MPAGDRARPAVADPCYRWHVYLFVLGLLAPYAGGLLEVVSPVGGLLLAAALGPIWFGSGVLALKARRHMFRTTPRVSNDVAFVRASEHGARSTIVVAAILILIGVLAAACSVVALVSLL